MDEIKISGNASVHIGSIWLTLPFLKSQLTKEQIRELGREEKVSKCPSCRYQNNKIPSDNSPCFGCNPFSDNPISWEKPQPIPQEIEEIDLSEVDKYYYMKSAQKIKELVTAVNLLRKK